MDRELELLNSLSELSALSPEAEHSDGRFHGTKAPRFAIMEEKPWHLAAAIMFARGETSAAQVARDCDVTPPTVYNLMRQPWFQERVTKLMMEHGAKDIMALFKGEAMNSLVTLVEIRDNDKVPTTVRRACAVDILDRGLGKPKQSIEMSDGKPTSLDPVAEAERLEQENQFLRPKTTVVAVRATGTPGDADITRG